MGEAQRAGKALLRSPIYLIGFMAVGKSTVGLMLAERLGLPFVDLDKVVEELRGLCISEIFQMEGEEGFREWETRALRQVSNGLAVVATGGGVVTKEENWRYLQQGITVALVASPEALKRRIGSGEGRPLYDASSWKALLYEREPLYRRAQVVIDTTWLTPGEVVESILEALDELESVGS